MAQPLRRPSLVAIVALCSGVALGAQTPQPFPRAQQPAPAPRQTPAPPPPTTTTTTTTPAAPARPQAGVPLPQTTAATTPAPPAAQAAGGEAAPTEAQLGFPVYPTAVFLRSFDAGRGQRYYLYGVGSPFAEMVSYYRNVLKEKGNLVFEIPPTHVFEIGKFREETMAFPPGVTVKDYTFSGSAGYPNPRPGQQPERFPTIIQIVPAPAASPQ